MSIEEKLAETGLHSLNPTIVNLYYGHIAKNRSVAENYLMIGKIRGKSYVFCLDDIDINNKKDLRIHTPVKIEGKISKYEEVVYELEKLEDKDFYGSKKSYYNAVRYPVNFIDKNYTMEMLSYDDTIPYDELLKLYDRWVDQKIQRGVHKISFPIARYRRCCLMLGNIKNLYCIVCRSNDTKEIVGFRIVLLDNEKAYDIAFVSDLDISQLSNCFNFVGLKLLKDKYNIKLFNCGVSQGKLKKYKQQFPNFLLTCYISGE